METASYKGSSWIWICAQIPDWVTPMGRCLGNSMFLNLKDQYNGILLNYQNIILGKFYERHKILYIHFQNKYLPNCQEEIQTPWNWTRKINIEISKECLSLNGELLLKNSKKTVCQKTLDNLTYKQKYIIICFRTLMFQVASAINCINNVKVNKHNGSLRHILNNNLLLLPCKCWA